MHEPESDHLFGYKDLTHIPESFEEPETVLRLLDESGLVPPSAEGVASLTPGRTWSDPASEVTPADKALQEASYKALQQAIEISKTQLVNENLKTHLADTETERRNAAFRATHDSLTGLPNRRWLESVLPGLLEQTPGQIGLLFIDIDGLKKTNDDKGHKEGDMLLQRFAEVTVKTVRTKPAHPSTPAERRQADGKEDYVIHDPVRIGGDEFVIILSGVDSQEEIEAVEQRLINNWGAAGLSASMGGRIHKPGETSEMYLNAVDALMYDKKRENKEQAATKDIDV